jgi:hypothetical protein
MDGGSLASSVGSRNRGPTLAEPPPHRGYFVGYSGSSGSGSPGGVYEPSPSASMKTGLVMAMG